MKKNGSHVGMILSFVIFITFLIFVLSVLQPAIKTNAGKQATVDFLQEELLDAASGDLTSLTLVLPETYSSKKDCVSFAPINGMADKNLLVKTTEGDILSSLVSPEKIYIYQKGNRFFKVFYSNETLYQKPLTNTSCEVITEDNYTIGSFTTKNWIFEDKIISIIERYATDYSGLKEGFQIPNSDDFGFEFDYGNETIVKTLDSDINTDVFAKEVLIQYVDSEANIKSGSIILKVW